MAAWPSNMAPGATPTASMPGMTDPAAFLELQRQQAETQYLQAWQTFAAISELSRAATAKAEVALEKPAEQEAQKPEMKETKVPERTPQESEKPAPATTKEEESKEMPEKTEKKDAAIPELAEKNLAKTDAANPGPETLNGKVVLRIRKVGTYTLADGSLEIYARWTPKDEPDPVQISQEVKIVSTKNAGEDKVDAASKEADYVRPTPKKMPVSASSSSKLPKDVKEPPYPP